MKLRKLLLNAMPVVILSTGLVSGITSCSSTNGLPQINSHVVKNVFINKLRQTSDGKFFYATSEYGAIEVHHFNATTIGYINVDDYVNYCMQFKEVQGEGCANFSSNTQNYKTTITNPVTNSTAVIDYEKQTITYSDFDMFCCVEETYKANPLAEGAGGGEKYYIKDQTTGLLFFNSVYKSGGEYVIDLKKYNIKAYYDNGKGYLPYDLFRNIFNRYPVFTMFYNGVNFYEICQSNSVNAIELYKTIKDEATILNKDYMEYCYNLFALTLDHKFGLTERLGRSEKNKDKTIKFFPNGAYEALAPYKDALTSLDPDVANDAMYWIFADLADDGGHAGYGGVDLLTTRPHISTMGPEKEHTFDVMDMIEEARDAIKSTDPVAPLDYWKTRFPSWQITGLPPVTDNNIHLYGRDEADPILYITFDGFNHVQYWTSTAEMEAGRVLYDDVNCDHLEESTADNYMLDTVRMTIGANKYINSYNAAQTDPNKKINKIVIDLSNNGGGTVYTEHVIASWLCGGVTEKIWNPHSKGYAEYTIKADLNNDGKFEEGIDYLPSSMNVYCITSDTSFSCGNMLPCNLVDNRTANTYYIGSPSGGGACFVDSAMHIGLGNVFRSSSNYHMLRGASTSENKISVESGHLDWKNPLANWIYKIQSTWEDCTKFVDRATINSKIRS